MEIRKKEKPNTSVTNKNSFFLIVSIETFDYLVDGTYNTLILVQENAGNDGNGNMVG